MLLQCRTNMHLSTFNTVFFRHYYVLFAYILFRAHYANMLSIMEYSSHFARGEAYEVVGCRKSPGLHIPNSRAYFAFGFFALLGMVCVGGVCSNGLRGFSVQKMLISRGG